MVRRTLRAATAALLAAAVCETAAEQHVVQDVRLAAATQQVKVRMFWVRHGQSCANVMDRCALKKPASDKLLPKVQAALEKYGGVYRTATLNETWGVQEANEHEADCSVELLGTDLQPQARGKDGAIIRIHDLYLDPGLTDCARHQSERAGKAFMRWLREKGIKVDFIGSSFLMRAFETAYAMFLEPTGFDDVMNCRREVTPLPFMTERAPAGLTSIQADNTPRPIEEQLKLLAETFKRQPEVNTHYADSWPRFDLQYEKFKGFLATQLVPSLGKVRDIIPWALAPRHAVMEAMSKQLPKESHPEDHGKHAVSFEWEGGKYQTGQPFDKAYYEGLEGVPEVTMIFVGHNQVMREYCLNPEDPKPNNNAALEKLFIMEVTPGIEGKDVMYAKTVLRELSSKCALVMDAPVGARSLASLVKEDVGVCRDPYDVSEWIGIESAGAGAGRTTQCMALADDPGAYPISAAFSAAAAAAPLTV